MTIESTLKTLDKIETAATNATPGPWAVGWWSGQGEKQCNCSRKGRLLAAHPIRSHPDWGLYHRHEGDLREVYWSSISKAVPDDYSGIVEEGEGGGVVNQEDAVFIAAADPDTVRHLVALARLAVEVQGPIRNLVANDPKNVPYWMFEWLSRFDAEVV
jgi:hypothetical protein